MTGEVVVKHDQLLNQASLQVKAVICELCTCGAEDINVVHIKQLCDIVTSIEGSRFGRDQF